MNCFAKESFYTIYHLNVQYIRDFKGENKTVTTVIEQYFLRFFSTLRENTLRKSIYEIRGIILFSLGDPYSI